MKIINAANVNDTLNDGAFFPSLINSLLEWLLVVLVVACLNKSAGGTKEKKNFFSLLILQLAKYT